MMKWIFGPTSPTSNCQSFLIQNDKKCGKFCSSFRINEEQICKRKICGPCMQFTIETSASKAASFIGIRCFSSPLFPSASIFIESFYTSFNINDTVQSNTQNSLENPLAFDYSLLHRIIMEQFYQKHFTEQANAKDVSGTKPKYKPSQINKTGRYIFFF